MEDAYKAKLNTDSSWRKLSNGKDALLWQAGVPASAKSNVSKQVYLTVVKGDYVLVLGGAVTDTTSESAAQQLLLNTIETLKTSDKPTDLQKLRETIRKESGGKLGVAQGT
jgi:hydrogenase maturation factor